MITMGVDPGMTIGLACIEGNGGDDIRLLYHGQVNGKEILKDSKAYDKFRQLFLEYEPDTVAIEDFIGAGPRNVYVTSTIKLVGLCTGLSYGEGYKTVVQVPMARKPFLPEAKNLLKGKVHETDALAHALCWYRRHGR